MTVHAAPSPVKAVKHVIAPKAPASKAGVHVTGHAAPPSKAVKHVIASKAGKHATVHAAPLPVSDTMLMGKNHVTVVKKAPAAVVSKKVAAPKKAVAAKAAAPPLQQPVVAIAVDKKAAEPKQVAVDVTLVKKAPAPAPAQTHEAPKKEKQVSVMQDVPKVAVSVEKGAEKEPETAVAAHDLQEEGAAGAFNPFGLFFNFDFWGK
jgi:hypothetical protein